MLALIGARGGSKRLPGKNTRDLGGKPLVDWTLLAAYESNCFSQIYLSTDSKEIAYRLGADVWGLESQLVLRPPELATDDSPDIDWIRHALKKLELSGDFDYMHDGDCALLPESFCLLRPTSPFRGPETIRRAVAQWDDVKNNFDSLRALRAATEHPHKTWRYNPNTHTAEPWLSSGFWEQVNAQPWNSPTQELGQAWIQTGGLEIAWASTYLEKNSLSGDRVAGFIVEGPEAMDLNTEEDWQAAEAYLASVGS